MAGVVETLVVNADRMREALDGGFSQAADLAEQLMLRCGLDYRRAYEVVGGAVRRLADDGRPLATLTVADLDEAAVALLGRTLTLESGRPERSARPGGHRRDTLRHRQARRPRRSTPWRTRSTPGEERWRGAAAPAGPVRRGRGRAARADPAAERAGRPDLSRRRMTHPGDTDVVPTLPERAAVVNVGLPLFAEAVAAQGFPLAVVDWRIPAGGDMELVAALGRLYGRRSVSIDAANAEVLRRLDVGTPQLTAVAPAGEVIPGLGDRMLLHCGPSITYEDARAIRSSARCGPRWWRRVGPRPRTRRAGCSPGETWPWSRPTPTTPWSRW